MKRRRIFVAVLAVSVLAVGLGWFLWPRHIESPRLKIVRQSVENGKSVVFFKVEATDGRRRQICDLQRDYYGDRIEPLPIQDVWRPLGFWLMVFD